MSFITSLFSVCVDALRESERERGREDDDDDEEEGLNSNGVYEQGV